jgi:P4 family phage/plasmid primase-like protien
MEKLFNSYNLEYKKILFNGITKKEINDNKAYHFKNDIENINNYNCYKLKLGKVGCIDTDNDEAEYFVNSILNNKGYIKNPSISNKLLKLDDYNNNFHRLFIIPDTLKDETNKICINGGCLDILFNGILYEPENYNIIQDEIYLIPELTFDIYNKLLKFKPTKLNKNNNPYYKDKTDNSKFWDIVENKFNQKQIADIYYSFNKDKYIYNKNLGWFSFDNYNKLINHKKDLPTDILTDMANCLQKWLEDNNKQQITLNVTDEIYNQQLKRLKIIKKCFNQLGTKAFVEGSICYLNYLYNNDDIENKLNFDREIIAFEDKIYNFKDGKFRDIRRDDYITITTGYKAPINDKNPDLIKEIDDLLLSIFNNQALKEYWKITTALSFHNNNYESVFFHNGSGGNGKGLLSNIISNSLGSYFMTTENTFLTSQIKSGAPNPTLATAEFCKYLLVSEPDDGTANSCLNPDFIKMLSGGDKIVTRALYRDNISYIPRFTINLQCNQQPKINKFDRGLIRRIKMIPYINNFVEKPTKINDKLINYDLKKKINTIEFRNNFMMLMLETATKNINKIIVKPEEVIRATSEYFEDNNPIKNFIDEHYILNEKFKTSFTDFKKHYEAVNECHITSQKLKGELLTNDFKVCKDTMIKIIGIKLKEEVDDLDK